MKKVSIRRSKQHDLSPVPLIKNPGRTKQHDLSPVSLIKTPGRTICTVLSIQTRHSSCFTMVWDTKTRQ